MTRARADFQILLLSLTVSPVYEALCPHLERSHNGSVPFEEIQEVSGPRPFEVTLLGKQGAGKTFLKDQFLRQLHEVF